MNREAALRKLAEFTVARDADRLMSYGGFEFTPAEVGEAVIQELRASYVQRIFE